MVRMPKPSPVLMTKQGIENIQAEYDDLQRNRPGYVIELTKASELGDRSENAAYRVAKQRLRRTDSRMRYLQKLLDRARVVSASQSEYVEIGSHVILNNGSKDVSFYIVGGNESDPRNGLISYQSPVGKALLGKRVGEKATVYVQDHEVVYRILNISLQ